MRFIVRAFSRVAIAATVLALGVSLNASAASTNLINNGSFTATSSAGTSQMLNYNGFTVDGWTNNNSAGTSTLGYNFLMTSGTATANGYAGDIALWNNTNGGTTAINASPDGGNFLAMDGAYYPGTVSQTVSGLTVGSTYQLSFYYAGAQQKNFSGDTTEGFKVSFGNDTYTTPILNNANHGFTGWQAQTVNFTASSTSETLSFLALGTPQGEPPFSLLDGVSMVQVTPEPSSLMLLGTGVLSVGGLLRRRFSN